MMLRTTRLLIAFALLASGSALADSLSQSCELQGPGDPIECCGDGVCNWLEDAGSCPEDCNSCGDGICIGEDDSETCPVDCGFPVCGDGACEGDENLVTCDADCRPALDELTVERISHCTSAFPGLCDPSLTRGEYHWWNQAGVAGEKQRRTFFNRVSIPTKKNKVRRLVFLAAGQQNVGDGDLESGVTGQLDDYKSDFSVTTASRPTDISTGSLAHRLITGDFIDESETLMVSAFDARFNFGFTESNKQEIEDAYFNWLSFKFDYWNMDSIYLAGHSRGGCLALRLAKRFNAEYPQIPLVLQMFDPVCVPGVPAAGFSGEAGVQLDQIWNPEADGDFWAHSLDMQGVFSEPENVRVFNYVSGGQVLNIEFLGIDVDEFLDLDDIRAFSADGAEAMAGDPADPDFEVGEWFDQYWFWLAHHNVGTSEVLMDLAVDHYQAACVELGC